jgi:hypothetical protein
MVSRFGERNPNPYLLPLSVDGLVVVASVSLVELAGRIRAAETAAQPATLSVPAPSPIAAAVPQQQAPATARTLDSAKRTVAAKPPAPHVTARPDRKFGVVSAVDPARVEQAPAGQTLNAPAPRDTPPPHDADAGGPPDDTVGAVAYWRTHEPTLSVKQIADKVGRSTRTVRRALDRLSQEGPTSPDAVDTARGTNGSTLPRLADAITSR